jgi:hypothetical protein
MMARHYWTIHVSDFYIVLSFPQGCSKLVCSLFEVVSLNSIICFLTTNQLSECKSKVLGFIN